LTKLGRASNEYKTDIMAILTTAQAAERLGVSVRRVQQLVKNGRLPAEQFGGALMIKEEDLELVENRKVGRPRKAQDEKAAGQANKKSRK
jgi:excisionase family DNA binding protein